MIMSSVSFRCLGIISTLSVTLSCSAVEPQAIAQTMRESNVSSIARVFDGATDDFQIQSRGGEIVFATLDADVYQTRGRNPGGGGSEGGCGGTEGGTGGCTAGTTITSADMTGGGSTSGGCSGGGGGGCGGGCGGEGGPGGFCLQVIDAGVPICWADRPVRPGWQRDPRLACFLPSSATPKIYTLRVALRGGETPGGPAACSTTTYKTVEEGKVLPYLLNVTLRPVASEGRIEPAIAQSNSTFGP